MRAATDLKEKFLSFYRQHEVLVSVFFFAGGFILDLLTLSRIDDLFGLIQQAIYLIILGTLILYEIKIRIGTVQLTGKALNFWQYHDLVVHFLFGSLLSVYTIFYYTSASALTSFLFILLLAGLMAANEIPKVQKLGIPVRVILFCICVLSYFAFFYPILIGHVGPVPFWLGFLTSLGVLALTWKLNFQGQIHDVLKRHVAYPALAIHLFFLAGYYLSLIPPVPMAVKKIGVYYNVEKSEGNYVGYHLRSPWKFWQKGSQDFLARPEDKIVVLLSIFSPAHFEDKIYLKWFYDDAKTGWLLEDSIPLTILGGREEGFRGFGHKKYFRPGHWRVIVETSDGREVGRIGFEIEADSTTSEREFKTDVF